MYQTIKANWNSKVKAEDTVYVIGGIMYFYEPKPELLNELNGEKILLLARQDRRSNFSDFKKISPDFTLKVGDRKAILTYYPLSRWYNDREIINIHGYSTQGPLGTSVWVSLNNSKRNMSPTSWEEIINEVSSYSGAAHSSTIDGMPTETTSADNIDSGGAITNIPSLPSGQSGGHSAGDMGSFAAC